MIDQNLAGFDAKVRSIIKLKKLSKAISIKYETIEFDQSLLECKLTTNERSSQPTSSSFTSSKRSRKPDYIKLRSPNTNNRGYAPHTKG